MRKSVSSDQMKALAMATAGATLASVATMFVPVAIFEGFTGATGLSEMVPAAAAPLGDTARALIAFGVGAFTLAVLAYLLLRQERAAGVAVSPLTPVSDDVKPSSSFKDRLARIAIPKMPWTKNEGDITELADLPKLRNGDSHPDAPPRRPLYAQQDLPVLDVAKIAVAETTVEENAWSETESQQPTPETAQLVETQEPLHPRMSSETEPTLAEMVAQLEAAVAERKSQLAQLEAVAAQLGADQVSAPIPSVQAAVEVPTTQPVRMERPSLEAVPTNVKDNDMDSALAAALATLHRMNGTNR